MDESLIVKAYRTIAKHLTRSWFEKARERSRKGRRFGFIGVHPLLLEFEVAGLREVSAIVELATYLLAFKEDHSLCDITCRICSAQQFEAARYEIAMAYRFKQALSNVVLAPEVGTRRGDFLVQRPKCAWVCECTREEVSSDHTRYLKVCGDVAEAFRRTLRERKLKVTIKICFRALPDASTISRMARRVDLFISRWLERPWHIYKDEDPSFSIEVYSFCDTEDPNPLREAAVSDWSAVIDHASMSKSNASRLSSDPCYEPPSVVLGRTFIRLPKPPESVDLHERIARDIQKKLMQISAVGKDQYRLILVEALGDFEDLRWDQLGKRIQTIVHSRQRVAGVGVYFRYYHDHRWKYGGCIVPNTESPFGVPLSLIEEFERFEHGRPYG